MAILVAFLFVRKRRNAPAVEKNKPDEALEKEGIGLGEQEKKK